MDKSKLLQWFCGMMLVACLTAQPAHAQLAETWVSAAKGNDANTCALASPCKTFQVALTKTSDGGRINVLDPGTYGPIVIAKSISIINDSGGTATTCCGGQSGVFGYQAQVAIDASPNNGIVTLRGLTIDAAFTTSATAGIVIESARRVDIENCTVLNASGAGIFVGLNVNFNGFTVNVNVENTTVNVSNPGIRVTAYPGFAANMSVHNSRITNNLGGGIRVDGTGTFAGGVVTVAVSDSDVSLNNSNGVLAVSGSGVTAVNVTRSVIASNGLYGVQSNQTNGGTATMIVEGSKILNNGSGQAGFFGGGTLLTAGNNLLVGAQGTGFSGPLALQ